MAMLTLSYESYWDNDLKLFTRAFQIAPKNPDGAEYLASVYINSHQPGKAEVVARALISDPNLSAQGWYILGTVRSISYQDYDGAREAFEKSRELFRHDKLLSNMGLASVDVKLGRTAEAVEIYRGELEKYPKVGYIRDQLATALEQMDRADEATRKLDLQKQQ